MLQESKTNELEYQRLSKEEMDKRGILGRLVGVCASFIAPTRNGRKYPEQLWENVFNDPIMKERIDNGVCYGELGHPADREETDMEKIAVCLAEQPKKGKDGKLRAVFDILNTPNGRILKSLCDYGSTLGISSRGSGDLETDFDGQESVNPDTYNCEGFDVVLIPAVKEARLQYVTEALEKKRYNKTLREKLTESISRETIENKKVINESLGTLGINLNETLNEGDIYSIEFLYDTYDDLTDVSDTNLRGYINVEANSPEQALKAAEEYCNTKGYLNDTYNHRHFKLSPDKSTNVKTIKATDILTGEKFSESLNESIKLSKDWKSLNVGDTVIQTSKDFDGTLILECEVIDKQPDHILLKPTDDKFSDMTLWVDDDVLSESLMEGQIGDLVSQTTPSGTLVRDSKGKVVGEFSTDDEATEFMNSQLNPDVSTYSVDYINYDDIVNSVDIQATSASEARKLAKKQLKDSCIRVIGAKLIESTHIDDEVTLLDESLSAEEKMDAWHNGQRRENIKACRDAKLFDYLSICQAKGYDKEAHIINDELVRRGYPDEFEEVDLSTKLVAKMFYGKLVILTNTAGEQFIKKYRPDPYHDELIDIGDGNKYFVVRREDEDSESIAKDLISTLNENYIIRTLSEAFNLSNEQITDSDNINGDSNLAAENDGAIVEELQKLLSDNRKLQAKIIKLQEKLSVSYTKEMTLEEELNKFKNNSIQLSKQITEHKALNEKLITTQTTSNKLSTKCNKLNESVNRKNKKIQSLNESLVEKTNNISKLEEQIKDSKKLIKQQDNTISTVTEKYETLNKDYQQMKESYAKKLEQQNNLVEKYRDIAVKSVNRYIDSQATRLGVRPSEIKNRLPESYSFKDIDMICEDLQEYKLNMSNLPFATNNRLNERLQIKATNVDNRTLVPNEDELDELTLRLAGL